MSARDDRPVPEDRSWLRELLPVAVQESRRHPLALAGLFASIALGALAIGMLLPKKYTATTTLRVEENGIAPLSEASAPPPTVAERAASARETALSPAVLDGVLAAGGWRHTGLGAAEQERLVQAVIGRTDVSSPSENLVRIAYTDSDPRRALAVARGFGELVTRESLAASARRSRDTFRFLDGQVEQYRRRLTESETRLIAYRAMHPDAALDADTDSADIGELRRQVAASRMDMAAQRAQESALRAQLAGVSGGNWRDAQVSAQLVELQAQLDKLRLDYTDRHPDVILVRQQIANLESELSRPGPHRPSRLARYRTATVHPAYADLQSRLGEANGLSAAASSRVAMGEALLERALAQDGRSAIAAEGSLDELTRTHEVNRELYQALLKRREEARVAMNLDAQLGGPGLSIQEPALLPLSPGGLRLRHVAAVGLGMAVLAPMLVLLALTRLDPRVRSPLQIERDAGLPVLGVIPADRSGSILGDRRVLLAALMVLLVLFAYGVVLLVKLVQSP